MQCYNKESLISYKRIFYLSVSEARTDDLVKDYIQQGMERANEDAISRPARVQVSEVCNFSSFVYTIHVL